MTSAQRVYLLRHGYSTFQESYDATNEDPGFIDARLAERGHEQVRLAAAAIPNLGIELVVTSPLTRAIQTVLGIFDGTPLPPVLVDARVRERLGDMCDIGRSPAELAEEYPNLDFAHLPERWWYDGPLDARGVPMEPWPEVEARARQFGDWLRSRPEATILVVSHFGLLRNLGATDIANCELREWGGELPDGLA